MAFSLKKLKQAKKEELIALPKLKQMKRTNKQTVLRINDIKILDNNLLLENTTKTEPISNVVTPLQDLTIEQLKKHAIKLTDRVLTDLKHAFMYDYTITQACHHALISRDTYDNWVIASSEFKEHMERAQSNILRVSRKTILKAIKRGNADIALKVLERREKGIYSTRSEITGEDGKPLQVEHSVANILKEIDGKANELINREKTTGKAKTIEKPTLEHGIIDMK